MTTLTLRPAGAVLAQTTRALAAWWASRAGRRRALDLHALDDRSLRDLGLHRSELGSIAAELDRRAEATRLRVLLAADR